MGTRGVAEGVFLLKDEMAGKISALSVQKKNKERVNVFIDGEYAFAVTLNTALGLKKDQHLDDTEIAELEFNDEVDKAFHRALSFLSYRARSRQEIIQYLVKKEVSEIAIDMVIERLEAAKYLDDAEFGRLWVGNRITHNPKGRRALQYELRQKGLSEKDIEASLEQVDEATLAWQAVERKLQMWGALDRIAFRKKLTGFLTRRGFSYDTIDAVFQKAWEGEAEEES